MIFALLLATMLPLVAEETESAISGIPTPPGAKITTEMSLDREQLEGQLPLMLSLQSGKDIEISPEELSQALGSLENIEFAEMKFSAKYSAADTLALFEKSVGGRRVIWNMDGKPGSGMVLIATADGGYFGARIKPTISKQGRLVAGTIKAIRTRGFLDPANAVKLAVPLMEQLGVTLKAPQVGK
jgi:hypothetical protein